MMSTTHLAVGMATALALTAPTEPKEILMTIAGGAIGGVFADCDIVKKDSPDHDALRGELIALGITVFAVAIDILFHFGGIRSIINNASTAIAGVIGFIILYIIGYRSDHRGFTHSIFAKWLCYLCTYLISTFLGVACFLGYTSHLAIDLLNKKGIRIFFPFKWRPCFKLCYAKGKGNTVFMILGFIATAVFLVVRIYEIV